MAVHAPVLAIFDIESRNAIDFDHYDPEKVEFACGVIRWVRYHPKVKGNIWGRELLHENVYWNPLSMLEDLMLPWHHAIVGWNARQFDLPVLIHQAIPEIPAGPMVTSGILNEAAAMAWHLETFDGAANPVVRYRRHPRGERLSWWRRQVVNRLRRAQAAEGLDLEQSSRIGRWIRRNRNNNRLVPLGAAGLCTSRAAMAEHIGTVLFDPLAELADITSHPHVMSLADLAPMTEHTPYVPEGLAPGWSHALVPTLWNEGRVWDVVRTCRDDVDLLDKALLMSMVGEVRSNRCHAEAFSNLEKGTRFRYCIPTKHWPERLQQIAAASRTH